MPFSQLHAPSYGLHKRWFDNFIILSHQHAFFLPTTYHRNRTSLLRGRQISHFTTEFADIHLNPLPSHVDGSLLLDPCKLRSLQGEIHHESFCIKNKTGHRVPERCGIETLSSPNVDKGYIAVYPDFPALDLLEAF